MRAIPHLDVLHVASRTPVTLPQRIDDELVRLLGEIRPLWFITHFNHVRELTPEVGRAIRSLIDQGITLQNQTLLLAGVNDSSDQQIELARALLKPSGPEG